MFCYQCEQTGKDGGCTSMGVCGKKPDVAALQDLLVYALEELSFYAVEARKTGVGVDDTVNVLTIEGLFHTLTNVDFDPERLKEMIERTITARDELVEKIKAKGGNTAFIAGKSLLKAESSLEALTKLGQAFGLKEMANENADITSLMHTLLFGIKGLAAYAYDTRQRR